MQRDDEVGCATEVAEGTAYQSWDWSNEAREGLEFQEIDSGKLSLWRNALEAGDSLWHQQAWDCKTKVETIGRYGTLTVKDLDWIFLRAEFLEKGILSDSLDWVSIWWKPDSCQLQDLLEFVSEISLNEEISQIGESLGVDVGYPLAEVLKTADRLSISGRIRVNSDISLLSESRRVKIFKTLFESLKLGETFSAAFVEGGYGVSGYGVVGYGV